MSVNRLPRRSAGVIIVLRSAWDKKKSAFMSRSTSHGTDNTYSRIPVKNYSQSCEITSFMFVSGLLLFSSFAPLTQIPGYDRKYSHHRRLMRTAGITPDIQGMTSRN